MRVIMISRKTIYGILITAVTLLFLLAVFKAWQPLQIFPVTDASKIPSPVEKIPPDQRKTADWIVIGAREEVSRATRYDGSYQNIDYPGGDVDPEIGACTDVIIRAYRQAGIDLQKLIHEDMSVRFSDYPHNWGLDAPDTNIDHRRIPNQVCFLKKYGTSLSLKVEGNTDEWQWGDIVYWKFANGDEHCGIISDRRGPDGVPLVIHNASIAYEENCLTRWEITGHYRYDGKNAPAQP